MYTIKSENFILKLTPVANSVMINVWNKGFSAESSFDTEDTFIARRGVPIGNSVRPITFIIKKEQRL